MTFKEKLILLFLSIITLGVYPIVIFSKKNNSIENEITIINKITVDIKKLNNAIGEDNFLSAEYTFTKIKIIVKDISKVDFETIKKLKGISGLTISSKTFTIIVGKSAKTISEALLKG